MRNVSVILYMLIFSIFGACTKSNIKNADRDLSQMYIYEDTVIASPLAMAESNDKLIISYATLNSSTRLIVTSLFGQIETSSYFPGVSLKSLKVLKDGTFILCGMNSQPRSRFIYFYHGNADGSKISYDSVSYNQIFKNIGDYIENIYIEQFDDNNFVVFGTYHDQMDMVNPYKGVIIKVNSNWTAIWSKQFFEGNESYYLTTCKKNASGNWAFLGFANVPGFPKSSNSYLYILEVDPATGSTVNKFKYHTGVSTGKWYKPYSAVAADMIANNDGSYLCFVNSGVDISATNNAYIYKVSSAGVITDSTVINQTSDNFIASQIQMSDGGYMLMMNRNPQSNSKLIFTQQNAWVVKLDHNLKYKSKQQLQSYYTDYFPLAEHLSDNRIAVFGIIQSFGMNNYNPVLMLRNE